MTSPTTTPRLGTLRPRTRRSELLAAVGQAITRVPELRAMLERCAQTLVESLELWGARIWLLDEPAEVLVLEASRESRAIWPTPRFR